MHWTTLRKGAGGGMGVGEESMRPLAAQWALNLLRIHGEAQLIRGDKKHRRLFIIIGRDVRGEKKGRPAKSARVDFPDFPRDLSRWHLQGAADTSKPLH
jgi:hypothetical protein